MGLEKQITITRWLNGFHVWDHDADGLLKSFAWNSIKHYCTKSIFWNGDRII